ncbi:hypothetical protein EXIGLDRAFT_744222 [Exidia glandulosa HHB12029]|uniref:C2H2-type domain-containing protein n=1 Tax=Exidia glandulosa HHB12029 TaxID=1314781 RepID=A0A165Q384_EXIGL|nr:hypothetical protein EXIGLDRAFT_744222 [Exidia glandulosa HHB12029]
MTYDAYGYPLHSGHNWTSHTSTPQWTLSNTSTPDSILATSPLPGTDAADEAIMKRAMYPYPYQTLLHRSLVVPNVVSPISFYSPDLNSPLALALNPYFHTPTPVVHFATQTPFSPSVPAVTPQPTHHYTALPSDDNSLGLYFDTPLGAVALPSAPAPAPAPTPPSVVTPATPATHVARRSKQRKTLITKAEVHVYKKIRRAAYGNKVFCAVPRCAKTVARGQYLRHLRTHARSFVRCQHCGALLSRDDALVRHEKVNCEAKEKSSRGAKNLKKGTVPDCN